MIDVGAKVLSAAIGGGFAAVMFASPAAAEPAPPPPPVPVVDSAPAPAAPVPAAATQAAPEGVPHLASPEALPPGSTMDPSVLAGGESPNVSYLRDLWQAVQNQELSGKEALLLGISQRNLNTPIPAQAPGPNVPTSAGDAAPAPAAPPAPAAADPAPAAPGAP
jgi:hypothetical protein